MKTIKYKIEFFSNWHCGSGLAAGADVDSLVIKDNDGLPFVPGKTIKGLLSEAVFTLNESTPFFSEVFGISGEKNAHKQGCAYFSNAVLPKEEARYIVKKDLSAIQQ